MSDRKRWISDEMVMAGADGCLGGFSNTKASRLDSPASKVLVTTARGLSDRPDGPQRWDMCDIKAPAMADLTARFAPARNVKASRLHN